MTIVTATLKTQILDGVELMDAPIGKRYLVDLDSVRTGEWHNAEHGRLRDLRCVLDVENGGFLPLDVLELATA